MIKKSLYIFLIILNFNLYSVTDQEKFIQANKLYNEAQYLKAIDVYEDIKCKDFAVLNNLASSYFRNSNYIQTVTNLKRAEKLIRHFKDFNLIDYNLNLVLKKMDIENEIGLFENFKILILRYNSLISLLFLQILFLILWVLIILGYFKIIKISKLILVLLFFSEIIIFGSIYFNYSFNRKKTALINSSDAILFAGPSEEYHHLKNIPITKQVEFFEKIGDWVKIQYDDSKGWIKSEFLNLL